MSDQKLKERLALQGGPKAVPRIEGKGEPKIVKKCSYPLTAQKCVSMIVTDMAVLEVEAQGLLLREVAPGFTPEEIQAVTEPILNISPELKEMTL